MHLGDVVIGRRQAGADRPDRLIGDDVFLGRFRQRSRELRADDIERLAGFALFTGFADADDRRQSGAKRGLGFGFHIAVLLAVIGAALGMADNDKGCPGVGQHFGADVAGVRAARLCVAILPADLDRLVGIFRREPGNQRRRRTDEDVAVGRGRAAQPLDQRFDFGARCLKAVHLPVAGDQWFHGFSLKTRLKAG